jgi:hypothetical protein
MIVQEFEQIDVRIIEDEHQYRVELRDLEKLLAVLTLPEDLPVPGTDPTEGAL